MEWGRGGRMSDLGGVGKGFCLGGRGEIGRWVEVRGAVRIQGFGSPGTMLVGC